MRLLRWALGRRVLLALALVLVALPATLALLVAGLLLARDLTSIPAELAAKVEREAGGTVKVGKADLRYWPRPRIVLENITFERRDLGLRVTAPRALIRLDLLDLIDGSVEAPNLILQNAEVHLPSSNLHALYASPRSLAGLLEAVTGSFAG